jgi:cyanophycin synthetase
MEGSIRVNIANALAATAATITQDVTVDTIRAALRTFANTVEQTSGRFNVPEIDGRQVLIDYCHNLHGLEALADFVKGTGGTAHRRRHHYARRPHRRAHRRFWPAGRPDLR